MAKNKNLPKNNTIKESCFLISNIKIIFNYLWLVFFKALIFWYFDLKYYIWSKTNRLGNAINNMLSWLIFRISLNKVITKFDLD